MNYIQRIRRAIGQEFNRFQQAFLWGVNGAAAEYDPLMKTYIEKGYNVNPIVYSVINAMSVKTSSVPIYVKEVQDEKALKKLFQLRRATQGNMTIPQKVREKILERKAFKDGDKEFPMERPNANQTWVEFIQLYKTFLKTTGNAYLYMLRVEDGKNAGKPMAIYILPSHQVEIVLHRNPELLGYDDPVKEYMLIEGDTQTTFPAEDLNTIQD